MTKESIFFTENLYNMFNVFMVESMGEELDRLHTNVKWQAFYSDGRNITNCGTDFDKVSNKFYMCHNLIEHINLILLTHQNKDLMTKRRGTKYIRSIKKYDNTIRKIRESKPQLILDKFDNYIEDYGYEKYINYISCEVSKLIVTVSSMNDFNTLYKIQEELEKNKFIAHEHEYDEEFEMMDLDKSIEITDEECKAELNGYIQTIGKVNDILIEIERNKK